MKTSEDTSGRVLLRLVIAHTVGIADFLVREWQPSRVDVMQNMA